MSNKQSNRNNNLKNNIKAINCRLIDLQNKNTSSNLKFIGNSKFKKTKNTNDNGIMLIKQVNEKSKCKNNDNYTPLPFKSNGKLQNKQEKEKLKNLQASIIMQRRKEYQNYINHKKNNSNDKTSKQIGLIQNKRKIVYNKTFISNVVYIQRKVRLFLLYRSLRKKIFSISSFWFEFIYYKRRKDSIIQTEIPYQKKQNNIEYNHLECFMNNVNEIKNNLENVRSQGEIFAIDKDCNREREKVKTSFDWIEVQNKIHSFTLERKVDSNRVCVNKRRRTKSKCKIKKNIFDIKNKENGDNNSSTHNNRKDNFYTKELPLRTENILYSKNFLNKQIYQNDNLFTKVVQNGTHKKEQVNQIKYIQRKIKKYLLMKKLNMVNNEKVKKLFFPLNINKPKQLYKSMPNLNSHKILENLTITNKSLSYDKIKSKINKSNVNRNKEKVTLNIRSIKKEDYILETKNLKSNNNSQLHTNKKHIPKNLKSNAYKILSNLIKHHSSLKSKIFTFDSFFEYNNNYILTHPCSFTSSSTIYNANDVYNSENFELPNIHNDISKDNSESQSTSTQKDIPIKTYQNNQYNSSKDKPRANACKCKLQCFPSIDISSNSDSVSMNKTFIYTKGVNHCVTMNVLKKKRKIKTIEIKKNDCDFQYNLEPIEIGLFKKRKKNKKVFNNNLFEYMNFQKEKTNDNISYVLSKSALELTCYSNPSISLFFKQKQKEDLILLRDVDLDQFI